MLVGGVWFVRIRQITNGWYVVYMGDEVEDRSVVPHDETNEQWELWGLMRWVGGHGTFGAHVVGGLLWTQAPLSKNCLPLRDNLKSTELITQELGA